MRKFWPVLKKVSLLIFLNQIFATTALAEVNPGVGTIDTSSLNGLPTDINTIIASLIELAYAVGGLIFFFMLIMGGLRYLTAGGDEKSTAAARNTLTNAFIGLIIIVAAFVITQLLFSIFKIQGFIKLG